MTVDEAGRKYYDHFMGQPISHYGLESGYVDYGCLARCGDIVLCNEITKESQYFELLNGIDFDEETNEKIEIFQYYIISKKLADILFLNTDEIVYYDWNLDIYVWGVTHWGTNWDYVLTKIPLKEKIPF